MVHVYKGGEKWSIFKWSKNSGMKNLVEDISLLQGI